MLSHHANMSVQYTAIFHGCKNDNFQMKIFDIFLIFAQNIYCGYTLEPPQRGGSNEYPQSMFWSKNKKNIKHFHLKITIFTAREILQYIARTCLRNVMFFVSVVLCLPD